MRTILLFTWLILMVSCDQGNNDPGPKTFVLDNTNKNGKAKGFLFRGFQFINYPNESGLKPDFIVATQVNSAGTIIGPFLTHPELKIIFHLSAEFSDFDSAYSFYQNYNQSNASSFDLNAMNVKPYQVWTIKTNDNKLGKVLIKNTRSQEIGNTPFSEVEFLAALMP